MKRQQKPTPEQADKIRQAELDPETVSVTNKSAALPMAITYHGDGDPVHYWIVRDGGTLRLSDTKPDFRKPKRDETEPGQGQPEATADFDIAHLYASDECVDADAVAHGLNRDEYEAQLCERGLTAKQAAAVYDCDVRKLTLREIARETSKAHSTIANELQRARAVLRQGVTTEPTLPVSQGQLAGEVANLSDAMWRTRGHLENYLARNKWRRADYIASGLAQLKLPKEITPKDIEGASADWVVASVTLQPRILQQDPARLAQFVEVIERARNYGSKGGKTSAASARKSLAILLRGAQGNRCGFPPSLLQQRLGTICVRIQELREAWVASFGQPIPARRAAIRCMIGMEQKNFTNADLKALLSDTNPLLRAAARVAEKATGIGCDVWERAAGQAPWLVKYLKTKIVL